MWKWTEENITNMECLTKQMLRKMRKMKNKAIFSCIMMTKNIVKYILSRYNFMNSYNKSLRLF